MNERLCWIGIGVLFLAASGCASRSAAPAQAASDHESASDQPEATGSIASPSPRAAAAVSEAEPKAKLEMPTTCADPKAKLCTPPAELVAPLCLSQDPDLALSMFRKDAPWTRAYLRLDTEAWYTKARFATPLQLRRGEEVLILASRNGGSDGVQIQGAGSYDVIRWDGACATVQSDEVTLRYPGMRRVADIRWRQLGEQARDALLENPKVKRQRTLWQDRCRDDSAGKSCEQAKEQLSLVIADHVRGGGAVPEPQLIAR